MEMGRLEAAITLKRVATYVHRGGKHPSTLKIAEHLVVACKSWPTRALEQQQMSLAEG